MEQYLEKGKEVLKILINNGCEAYLIGGAVCNTILQIPFEDVDITTNATPEMVKGIFSQTKVEDENEGSVRLYYSGYQFLINTFRVEEKYKDNRKPLRIHYSKNLHDDLARRDFTINAIAMSHGGKLTDAYRGFEDIQKKRVKTIGNPKVRFSEDPIRILIAIRFVSELGFIIERKTLNAISKRAKLLTKLPIEKMVKEIKRILSGKHFKKALKLIIETNLYKRIPILNKEFKRLEKKYRPESVETFLACALVKNGKYVPEWEGVSDDPVKLKKVVDLAIVTPKSKYDSTLLFSYGLEICQEANYVNFLLNKAKKRTRKIKREYDLLPITKVCELKFKGEDILQLTSNQVGDYVQTIVDNMVMKILKNELINDYDALKIFAIQSLREMGILPSLENDYYTESIPSNNEDKYTEERVKVVETKEEERYIPYPEKPSFIEQPKPIYPESKFDQIEKSLREKDEKIKELERRALEIKLDSDINNIVGQNLEILKDMNYIEKGTEKVLLSRELKELYRGLITNVDPKLRSLKDKNPNEGKE